MHSGAGVTHPRAVPPLAPAAGSRRWVAPVPASPRPRAGARVLDILAKGDPTAEHEATAPWPETDGTGPGHGRGVIPVPGRCRKPWAWTWWGCTTGGAARREAPVA